MSVFDCRAPRSAVIKLRDSRSFVAVPNDEKRVARYGSCTRERLHT